MQPGATRAGVHAFSGDARLPAHDLSRPPRRPTADATWGSLLRPPGQPGARDVGEGPPGHAPGEGLPIGRCYRLPGAYGCRTGRHSRRRPCCAVRVACSPRPGRTAARPHLGRYGSTRRCGGTLRPRSVRVHRRPGDRPDLVVQPGHRCTTVDGVEMCQETASDVRTRGSDADWTVAAPVAGSGGLPRGSHPTVHRAGGEPPMACLARRRTDPAARLPPEPGATPGAAARRVGHADGARRAPPSDTSAGRARRSTDAPRAEPDGAPAGPSDTADGRPGTDVRAGRHAVRTYQERPARTDQLPGAVAWTRAALPPGTTGIEVPYRHAGNRARPAS